MSADLPIQMLDRRRVSQRPKKAGVTPPMKPIRNFLLRMPIELADKVDQFSRAAWRSQTAEIVRRLEASFENQSIDEHGVIVQHIAAVRK